jgi:hypothetical protein
MRYLKKIKEEGDDLRLVARVAARDDLRRWRAEKREDRRAAKP